MTNTSIGRGLFNLAISGAGWCAVGLGVVGAFVPGLPTTVFVLVAFCCFSKSSPRFARWLTEHRRLGSAITPILAEGGLPRTAKRAALTAMWTSILGSSAVLSRVHLTTALVTVGLGIAGTAAICFGVRTAPTRPNVANASL
jgi:uncharacterized membrane protein YbaN (DUF454 family)